MLGLVRHRAIVQVDRLVRLDDRWALVMEYVPGSDLHALIPHVGRIPLGPALECVEEVASALHTAYHAPPAGEAPDAEPLRLVHRDVKPANIRVTPAGEVKLLDFGIARAQFPAREAQTQSMRYGSLAYVSPQRLAMRDDGHPGDIYSLGSVLFEMVTGEQLGMSTHHQRAHEEVVASALAVVEARGLPPDVHHLLERCLSYGTEDRPDARQFLEEARRIRLVYEPDHSLLDWISRVPPVPPVDAEALNPSWSGTVLQESTELELENVTADFGDRSALRSAGVSKDLPALEVAPRRRGGWGLIAIVTVVVVAAGFLLSPVRLRSAPRPAVPPPTVAHSPARRS